MIDYSLDDLINIKPYSLNMRDKKFVFEDKISKLVAHHYKNCKKYKKMFDVLGKSHGIPVGLFKEYELLSVPEEKIFKVMTSSGTTGQKVSKIFLDKETATLQQKILMKIISDFLGSSRLPMIIIDSPSVIKDRNMFSARGAGILGFSIFARDKIFALDSNMVLQIENIKQFLEKHENEKIFLFGFTFMIWQHFYKELANINEKIDLSNTVMLHGGGWKKMLKESVDSIEFKKKLCSVCGIKDIHNYYGMVEQTGSIFVECEYGHFHSSIFSDILIRRPEDFSIAQKKEKGFVELFSLLPISYPGHILLTEDEGEVLGEDDCRCGRLGKYFKIHGRIKGTEIRGCSDTYER
jgi:phenylacetate-coenzyme A ligase PaaK-like adenylate-forming protein